MKLSPIQLVHLSFRRVSVEVDAEYLRSAAHSSADAHALLEGVVIKTEVSKTAADEEDPRGTPYFLTLRVLIDNAHDDADSDRTISPYRIDVEAGAMVVLAKGTDKLGDPDDLIAVNGPALMWGAIREQVANITSRMPIGMAMLPSVNFHDLRKTVKKAAHDEAAGKKPARPTGKNERAKAKKP
ncbi:hypothetical protein [Tahibacter caeni]|uniref:hypothetical protein n=1 Tax=Tahibacter caeni TaxID=1453545 RepID=UPI002149414D|nr:hypothetical protein [Tahibacter caeni]